MKTKEELIDQLLEFVNDEMRSKVSGILQLEMIEMSPVDKFDVDAICLKFRRAMDLFEVCWDEAFTLKERLENEKKQEHL